MKTIRALKYGALRAVKVWKGVLIVWFFYFLLVSLVAIPMQGALKSGFGRSMITEKLKDGINVEVFSDLGSILSNLTAYFSSGLFLLLLFGMLMNAFLTGGLFDSLKGTSVKFSSSEFFRTSARNFWSFLVMTLIINIIILFMAVFIIGLPAGITIQSYTDSGTTSSLAIKVALIILISVIITLIIVADYARSWQVANENPACFKALVFGFNRTFRTFLSSFPAMVVLLSVQVLFAWLVLKILGPWKPLTGGGIFLLFLISQFLFFIRILLKTWRYASVTSLKEINDLLTDPQGRSNI